MSTTTIISGFIQPLLTPEGVAMMPVGSKFRFWIPGELAYGTRRMPQGGIGPNAMLVFDVELMAIL